MKYVRHSRIGLESYFRQRILQLIIMTIVLFFSGMDSALAQIVTPSDQEELRHRTQQEAEEGRNRKQTKDTFLQSAVKSKGEIILPIEDISFSIHTLQLLGERVDEFSWVQDMLNQYQGQNIGKEGINLIVKHVTNTLISRGYTTSRIGIPEQDLSSGILKLTFSPGIIGDIRFVSPECHGNWYTAFPTRPGNILNIRDLEQGLEQIKRVPSQEADMKIMPGKKPGESDIIISLKTGTPIRTTLSLDDSGAKATGKLQASTSFSIDNPLGINDLFYISLSKDGEQKESLYGSNSNSFQYSFPYGYWTFTLARSAYDYKQTLQGRNLPFVLSGKSDNLEFRIQRLIHRDQQSKTSLQFAIIKKHSNSFIDDTELIPQRKDLTAGEIGIIHRQYFGKTVVDINLAQRRGVSWFHVQSEPENPEPGTPTTRYQLWTLDATVTSPVQIGKIEGKYSCNFRAQTTKDLVYTADYFSIGNRYTVRGFDGEQTLAAENGWFVRNELSVPIDTEKEAYIGLDYGQVSGPQTQWLLGRKLAGAALGIRGSKGKLHYDLFVGCPIYKPQGYQTASPVYGFQLIYQM